MAGTYATLADVQARLPQFELTPTSKPTEQTAQALLDDTHAEFEGAMANLGYKVPITGPNSILQSKTIVSQGAICKILTARAASVGGDAAFLSADRACKAYSDALLALADENNPFDLSDAETVPDGGGAKVDASGLAGGPIDGCGGEPRATMDQLF